MINFFIGEVLFSEQVIELKKQSYRFDSEIQWNCRSVN